MGGSLAWNRLAAGTSADTWRTPGHPAWCWSLSWKTSGEWTERKVDQKTLATNTITVIGHVANLVNVLKWGADLFKKGNYEEWEESEADWRQQARLLDGQNVLSVWTQRVDGSVGQGVSGVPETRRHRPVHS